MIKCVVSSTILLLLGATLLIFNSCGDLGTAIPETPYELVNPFIGTGGHGHTYPGASLPFGMMQLSPDTRLTGWDGCSGYHYTDDTVYGFSHTHLSGTGIPDYADILFLPDNSGIKPDDKDGRPGNCMAFSHEDEVAQPGFYSVKMRQTHEGRTTDYGVELTTSARCGFHRYTYSQNGSNAGQVVDQASNQAKGLTAGQTESLTGLDGLLLNLDHRDETMEAKLRLISPTQIEGYRISSDWAEEQHVYFYAEFNRPIYMLEQFGQVSRGRYLLDGDSLKDKLGFNHALPYEWLDEGTKAQFYFPAIDSGQNGQSELLMKIGISSVSMEGARKNLEAEIPHWRFDQTRTEAKKTWSNALGKITVKGNSPEEQSIFYTALYHSMLAPNLYMDVDSNYRGMDKQIRKAAHTHHTVFSLWDTYRAAHPLFTIVEQERSNEFIKTLLADHQDGGRLPIWELASNYTDCMIGYHAIPVIADAWEKGIRDYDEVFALDAMVHSATLNHFGLKDYRRYGFIPSDKESESVSKTLEYAYDDWCIARMAESMGVAKTAEDFYKRAQNYRSLYDPSTGFMRARRNGAFVERFDPAEVNFHFTEANSWQYSLYAPQDIAGLISLIGGKEPFEKWLDALFTAPEETTGREQADITGLIGQYAHGNEPSHHMAYLYNYIGLPWKTQERVREICRDLYTNEPDGLSGNEDCGQMSAWYVLSASGFYPVTPGDSMYAIGSPSFEEVTYQLENGNSFTIKAKGAATKTYVIGASLNGKAIDEAFISHHAIMRGGELVLEMAASPYMKRRASAKQTDSAKQSESGNQTDSIWGANPTYTTQIAGAPRLSAPYLSKGNRIFDKMQMLELAHLDPEATVVYSLNGGEEQVYTSALKIDTDSKLSFRAEKEGYESSANIRSTFTRLIEGRTIKLGTVYASQYAAGGDKALIDQLEGTNDFRTGLWQGYEGIDLIAEVDLGKVENITELSTGFLQDENSWIFMPEKVNYQISVDGKNWTIADSVGRQLSPSVKGAQIRDYKIALKQPARYIKVQASNRGTCPDWHKGAGGKSWIFVDEIRVKTKN